MWRLLPLQWGLGHSVEQRVPPRREMELNQKMSGSPGVIFWHSNHDCSVLLSQSVS